MRLINPQSTVARLSRTDWLVIGALLIIFVAVALVSTLEKAFAVSMSLGVFAAVVQQKWDSRRDPRMWALLGAVAAGQLSAICLIHIPRFSTGLIFVPVGLAEGFALWGLLNWIERRFPRT